MEPPGVDALYGEPLDTFTAARNALAKALVQAADREGAAAVKALRKPSTAAWALNQLARTRFTDVERLLAAGERLRHAQHDALEGGDPSQLRDARRAHDDEVDRLANLAAELLAETGKPAGPVQHDRLTSTLQAAAVDDDSRELLRRRVSMLFGMELPARGASRRSAVPAPPVRKDHEEPEDHHHRDEQ